jgi:hypothetical protein
MAGREYIYVQTSADKLDVTWDLIVERLNNLAANSAHGFNIVKPKDVNWFLIDLTRSIQMDSLLPEIVHLTGDHVFAFEYQTVVDGFAYWHYHNHQLLRHLDYGMYGGERSWNASIGEAEPWEGEVIFSDENMKDDLDGEEDEETAQKIRNIYSGKTIQLGSFYPFLGSHGAFGIVGAMGLPGAVEGFEPERDVIIHKPKKRGFLGRLFGNGK